MAGTGQRGKGCIQNPRNWTAWSRNGEKQCEQVKMNVLVTPRSLLSWKLGSVIPRSPDSSLYAIKNYTESHSIWGNHQEQNHMHRRRNSSKGKFLRNLSVPDCIRIIRLWSAPCCLHVFTSFLYPRKQRKEQKTQPENTARFSQATAPGRTGKWVLAEDVPGVGRRYTGKEHASCVPGPSFMCLAPIILQNLAMILLPPLPRWRSCGGPENIGSLSKIKQYTNYSPRIVSGNGSPSLSTGEYIPNASGCQNQS